MTVSMRTEDPFDVPGMADDPDPDLGEDKPTEEVLYREKDAVGGAAEPPGPAAAAQDEPEPGTRDERELWRAQQALIDEDDKSGIRLEGFPEDAVPAVLNALGDDAAETLPDSPNGTSATGDWAAPEHGGFPERRD